MWARETSTLIEAATTSAHQGQELTTAIKAAFQENIVVAGKIGTAVDEIAAAVGDKGLGAALLRMMGAEALHGQNAEGSKATTHSQNHLGFTRSTGPGISGVRTASKPEVELSSVTE